MANPPAGPGARLAPRNEKILIAMYQLGADRTHSYEDIVVSAFKHFPAEFAMRGHPEYPDSSDVHKPLYKELKAAGYVTARDKRFRLTIAGAERAHELIEAGGARTSGAAPRSTRETEKELRRLMNTEAARLWAEGQLDKLIDTDFHEFFGTSVRIGNRDFQGRLNDVKRWIAKGIEDRAPEAKGLEELRKLLLRRFEESLVKPRGGEA